MGTEIVKIVRFHTLGSPEVLQLDELPLPEPATGEIRLRVKTIDLNRADAYFRQNRFILTPKLPSKIGYEASGVVEAVGPGVNSSWLGKTASTVPAFPADVYGVYGEVAIVPANAISEYPACLSYEEGADHVIVTDEEDLRERVRAITGGGGAHIILDPIGGKGLCALTDAAAPSGIIFEYGALADDATPYPLSVALGKHLILKAYSLFEG